MEELKPCRFCGEDFQLQLIRVDFKNPGRDLIKCRKCRGEAPRKYWNRASVEIGEDEIWYIFPDLFGCKPSGIDCTNFLCGQYHRCSLLAKAIKKMIAERMGNG